ncbi:MAG: RDD family protein [Myxococcales bacterium]|nr:RDD family protein [Myxococcales bacterium]
MVCPHCAFPNLPGAATCAKCRRPLAANAGGVKPDWMKAPAASPPPPPPATPGETDPLGPALEKEKAGDLRSAFLLGQDLLIEHHGDLEPEVLARAYVFMARVSLGLGKNERADKYLQRARALRPQDPEIARLVAKIGPPAPAAKTAPVPHPPAAPATPARPAPVPQPDAPKTAVSAKAAPAVPAAAPKETSAASASPEPEPPSKPSVASTIPKKSAGAPPPLPLSAAVALAADSSKETPAQPLSEPAPVPPTPPPAVVATPEPLPPPAPVEPKPEANPPVGFDLPPPIEIAPAPPPPPEPKTPEASSAPPPPGPEAQARAVVAPAIERPVRPEVSLDGRACFAAGFWMRALALLLDEMLIGAILTVVLILSSLVLGLGAGGILKTLPEQSGTLAALAVLFVLSSLAYLTLFAAIGGQTLGKMILGLRVVTRAGHSLGAVRALLRLFGMFLASLPGLAGFLWAAFDRERRGWHDYVSGTLVVRLRPPRGTP